jgi:rhodanese-related sulfurtransferase
VRIPGFGFGTNLCQHPQKFDSLYKTIYAKDLCQLLEAHPSIVLLDVRTPGEFNDSSQRTALNMGHLKGAVNLHIDSIQKNNNVMEQFRDKTLVIYCSHSQRSRRVSKLLSEKGFTDFYNLNGGMSDLNQMSDKQFPCKEDWIVSSLGYKNLSNAAAAEMIATDKRLLVLDVRPTAQFNGTDSAMENNLGKIKGAINIPYADLAKKAAELQKYKEQPFAGVCGKWRR